MLTLLCYTQPKCPVATDTTCEQTGHGGRLSYLMPESLVSARTLSP